MTTFEKMNEAIAKVRAAAAEITKWGTTPERQTNALEAVAKGFETIRDELDVLKIPKLAQTKKK